MRSSLVVLAFTGALVSAVPVPLDLGGIAMEFASEIVPRIGKNDINFEKKSPMEKLAKNLAERGQIRALAARAGEPDPFQRGAVAGQPSAAQGSRASFDPSVFQGSGSEDTTAASQSRWPAGTSPEVDAAREARLEQREQFENQRLDRGSRIPDTSGAARMAAGFADSNRGGNALMLAGGRGGDPSRPNSSSALASWREKDGPTADAIDPRTAGLGSTSVGPSASGLTSTGTGQYRTTSPFSRSQYSGSSGSSSDLIDPSDFDISSRSTGGGAGGIPRMSVGSAGAGVA